MTEQKEQGSQPPEKLIDNRLLVIEAVDLMERDLQTDPHLILKRGRREETVLAAAFESHLGKIRDILTRDTEPFILIGGGLTRSGKTLSSKALGEYVKLSGGYSQYLDFQGAPLSPNTSREDLLQWLEENTKQEPSLLVLDEFSCLRDCLSDEQIADLLKRTHDLFPKSIILTINIYFRNRGKTINSDQGIDPVAVQQNLVDLLYQQGLPGAESFMFSDAWSLPVLREVINSYLDEKLRVPSEKTEALIRKATNEIYAITIGNPLLIMACINQARTEGEEANELPALDRNNLSISQLSSLYEKLRTLSEQLFVEKDVTQWYEILDEFNTSYQFAKGKFSFLFQQAFSGYPKDYLTLKMLLLSLMWKSSAQNKRESASIF